MGKSISKSEILEVLEGAEVLSEMFEGCVGIENGKIIREGEVVVENPSRKQLSRLLSEYAGGPYPIL